MSKQKCNFYEETWFCVLTYFIFFPVGLFLAFRSKKISKDVKNLMKFGVIILILIYAYFAAGIYRFKSNAEKKNVSSETSENLDVVNKEEFIKQGNGTIKDIQGLLSKYQSKVSSEQMDEVKAKSEDKQDEENKENSEEKSTDEDTGVLSTGNMVKIKGDPYEYNVSYNTSTEEDIGKVNLLITVKYPREYVLDFSKSQFMHDILAVMESNNYDFDSFKNWAEKSEKNYSGKNVINSTVYSREVCDVSETLNFNTGEDGIMQVGFTKKVEVQ